MEIICYRLVPFRSLKITKLLAFTVRCSIGPNIREGHTVTTSSPLLFANSKASLSASVLESVYQFWKNLELGHSVYI